MEVYILYSLIVFLVTNKQCGMFVLDNIYVFFIMQHLLIRCKYMYIIGYTYASFLKRIPDKLIVYGCI